MCKSRNCARCRRDQPRRRNGRLQDVTCSVRSVTHESFFRVSFEVKKDDNADEHHPRSPRFVFPAVRPDIRLCETVEADALPCVRSAGEAF